jgi:hypothetical protein
MASRLKIQGRLRFEEVRRLCSTHTLLLTILCSCYYFAFISVCINTGLICIVRVMCIVNLGSIL